MKVFFLMLFVPIFLNALDEQVRVRLQTQQSVVEISGENIRINGQASAIQPVAISKIQNLKIERVSVNGIPMWQVESEKQGFAQTKMYSSPILAIHGYNLRQMGRSLPNHLLLAGKEKIDVVGVLPLNNYLVGVVSSEMPLNWPLEALKAQAIAARSYTLATMKERRKQLFHVESSILDQVFNHVSQELDGDRLIEKAKTAVNETENLILNNSKQKVVKAFYHSDCGGKTSSARSVWGVGELVGGAVDDTCSANVKSNWNLKVNKTTLTQKITKYFSMNPLNEVVQLITKKANDKDRITDIAFAFADGVTRSMNATDFRSLMGTTELRSTRFDVQQKDDQFQFSGHGFGHGVGLCQWGTRALAQKGWNYKQILSHYYPESYLSKM